MKKAKSRIAHNKGCKRVKTLGGYSYYKGSRVTPFVLLAASITLSIFSMLVGGILDIRNMEVQAIEYKKPLVLDTRDTNISSIIEDAVDEFLPNHRSESLMIMHCLAHRESGHGVSKAHGDGGLAGGPYQFHEATWQRMRKQMIKQGYAEEIGSRYDLKEAIRTTAWAIREGRALEWGPILRDSKGSDYASCQTPSWY